MALAVGKATCFARLEARISRGHYAEALDLEEGPADVRARRIPSSWIDGVARLDHHRPLTDIAPHRWRQFLSDCNNFLTGGENWAGRAAELGWNAASLFGCSRARPLAHPGGAGLLWAIQGGRLVLTRTHEAPTHWWEYRTLPTPCCGMTLRCG